MKDHIPEGDQWLIRMFPDDKIALDQLKEDLHAKSYRDVIVQGLNALKPSHRLYLRKFGDIEDDLPGLYGIVMNMYVVKEVATKESFQEFMISINRITQRERQDYQRLFNEKESETETSADYDRFVE